MKKPHIYLYEGMWFCVLRDMWGGTSGGCGIAGCPADAYNDWLAQR